MNKEILRLSLPAIVSNITVPILGFSDTAISGHLGSEIYIAAIAVGTMMFNVAFWLFGFLRMGTTGLTAQAFGTSHKAGSNEVSDECRILFGRSFLLALCIGLLLIAFHVPLQWILLWLISPDSQVAHHATDYFNICIIAAPAVLATMSVSGWFLGMQDTIRPMIVSVFVNVVNIIASLTLVFIFDAGFKGVAYGTLVANWAGLLLALYFVVRFCGWQLFPADWHSLFRLTGLGRFFRVNTDILFRSACIMAVSLSVTAIGAHLGSLTLAANAIMMQFFILFSYFMDGFAFAAEALTGRFVGARDECGLMRVVKYLCVWGAGVAIIFTLIYVVEYEKIISLLTSEGDVLAEVENYSLWLKLIPIVTVAAFVFDGIFIGLTATRKMLVVTFISALLFFGISFIHPMSSPIVGYPDNDTLWLAFLAYLLMRGVLLGLFSSKLLKESITKS